MISLYCSQTAQLERRTGYGDTGEAEYADPVDIQLRYEGGKKLIRSADGEAVASTSRIMTVDEVAEGDRVTVDGNTFYVMKATPAIGLNGNPLFWEAELQ